MAPSRRFRRRRRRGFLPFRSFFFRALALRRRPLSRRHLARHRQAQAAAALGTKLLQAQHSMELQGPRRKQARARCGGGSGGGRSSAAGAPDLLSDLPDCLLHTIMSFMKARQVVQTCVLSKRWRHLWRSVPCLNVDVAEFKTKTTVAPRCSYDKAMNWDVDEFKTTTAAPGCSCDKAMNWKEWGKFVDFTVNLAQRCNIALLDSLRLHGHGDRTPLLFLRLGNLSEIAASPTLKTLAIYGGLNDPLVIFAPAVAYLHLAVKLGGFAAGISIKEMPSLDKAMIQLFRHRYYVPNTELSGDRFKFLHIVSNVTSLELCSVGGMVLGKEPTSKEFQNLKNLLLSHCDLSDDCILDFFSSAFT